MPDPLYLTGQTGSGKSAVALELARRIPNAEIINADAFQVYRGLEIVSAAPSPEERQNLPHHLYGHLLPQEACDAASFAKMAQKKIDEVSERGTPLVVGGSGLYLKAITHGLAETPPGDPELRKALDAKSLDELVSQFQQLDPEGAARTNLKNRRYVTRSLEICLLTDQPASSLKNKWLRVNPDLSIVYLQREREDVYRRINERTRLMFTAGVIDEIASLGQLSTTAAKAIGVREIKALLAGELEEEECISQIQQATRRLAKRQETWFRRESGLIRIPVQASDPPAVAAESIIRLPMK
ncbi:MAG: tRNA (adenosine(37)-N6)-dimethylallyltransferase MiaA [Verrucomicrobiota bacterium]